MGRGRDRAKLRHGRTADSAVSGEGHPLHASKSHGSMAYQALDCGDVGSGVRQYDPRDPSGVDGHALGRRGHDRVGPGTRRRAGARPVVRRLGEAAARGGRAAAGRTVPVRQGRRAGLGEQRRRRPAAGLRRVDRPGSTPRRWPCRWPRGWNGPTGRARRRRTSSRAGRRSPHASAPSSRRRPSSCWPGRTASTCAPVRPRAACSISSRSTPARSGARWPAATGPAPPVTIASTGTTDLHPGPPRGFPPRDAGTPTLTGPPRRLSWHHRPPHGFSPSAPFADARRRGRGPSRRDRRGIAANGDPSHISITVKLMHFSVIFAPSILTE